MFSPASTDASSICEDDSPDAQTLRRLQRHAFGYFIDEVNPANGMVRDKSAADWPASIAAIGMALTAYVVGADRQCMPREDAVQRTLATLRFLATSEQSVAPNATGYRGFYYHFLDMQTGRRAHRCELSSIDTALLIAGALTAAAYFDTADPNETEIRALANFLYQRVDWVWMLNGQDTICHGWRPGRGFLRYHWQGYDEALAMYLMALGSPAHPIHPRCYAAWCRTHKWKKIYGIAYLYAGPLFIHQMSHIWCDLRGVRDPYMRAHGSDYFENSRRATLVHQQYAIRNPKGFRHLGALCWGISAGDGPGYLKKKIGGVDRTFYDYVARGAPFGPDDGTLAPWAVAASLPFAPEIVAPTVRHFAGLHIDRPNADGYKRSFNPLLQQQTEDPVGWISRYHFGINEGLALLLIENHRTGLIWSLTRSCAAWKVGFKAAGFEGGWLD